MNVTKEMGIFRSALRAIVPIMEEAGIGWKDTDQYDEFELISENLFCAFITKALHGKSDCGILDGYRYDFPPYMSISGHYLAVNLRKYREFGIFVRLSTREAPFDSVVYVVDDREVICNFSDVEINILRQ